MIGLLAAGVLSPFYLTVAPEVRSSYVSLGKIVEDRPMQVTFVRAGYDTGLLGRIGFYNWDVSSLTDRRLDAHHHALYHTEFGPTWSYDIAFSDDWRLCNDLMYVWTLYRRFRNESSDGDFWWWQFAQTLENPYVVPYYRVRRYVDGVYYFWYEVGLRRRFGFLQNFYVTPTLYADGGNDLNYKRVIGTRRHGSTWDYCGATSVAFRLELGWQFCSEATAFVFVEQYEVVGDEARHANARSTYRCAHNDWTIGGAGVRFRF